jgi:hypothetical protein
MSQEWKTEKKQKRERESIVCYREAEPPLASGVWNGVGSGRACLIGPRIHGASAGPRQRVAPWSTECRASPSRQAQLDGWMLPANYAMSKILH